MKIVPADDTIADLEKKAVECEVTQNAIAVSGSLVFAFFVHKPNEVKAVLATVVADAELATNFAIPFPGCSISADEDELLNAAE